MKSSEQLTRLLKLVPYLQQHQGISVGEVAQHFGVSERQVVSDIEVLQFCGLPEGFHGDLFEVDIDEVRDAGHIFFRNADVLARPMRMRLEEATSLLVALEVVVETSGGSEAALSALAKLRDVVGGVDPAVSVAVAAGAPEHRQVLQRAIDGACVVELTYLGSGRRSLSRPEVEPVRLRVVDGFAYVDAWSRERADWRSYRLDRIESLSVTDATFAPREGLPDGSTPWFDDVAQRLVLELTPEADWVAEYYPVTHRHAGLDHICVTFPMASPQWAVALLLRLGASVTAVSDNDIALAAAAEARAALAHYAAGDPPD
ncbi:MAG: WYL domain-containing protein [Arachnia sp.]